MVTLSLFAALHSLWCMHNFLASLEEMDSDIEAREYGWTDSSDTNYNLDMASEELESDLLSSDSDEIPFARHGPVVYPDPEDVATQCDFWSHCAIGFLLEY